MPTPYDIVKAHYAANDRRDLAGMIADVAPDTIWIEMAGFPCAGTYIGPDAVVEHVFKALGALFEDYSFTLERLLDAGPDVVGVGDYAGTHRGTGRSFRARVVHLWHVEDGKIRRFEQFTDTRLVAQAMG